jgi:DNA-binding response OmpR family regulator
MKKILIVDDDQDLLKLLSQFLQQHSFKAETVGKTSEVFMKIDSFKPDLILLDIHLSGFDGRDICRELKSHPKTRGIPVIIVSGDSAKQDQLKAAGADGFIEKPLDTGILIQAINSHFRTNEFSSS